MTIGQASRACGVAAKTIRYYEEVGLIPSAQRSANGYRHYYQRDVDSLRFVHRARHLGFSLEDIAALLALWSDRNRASADVRTLASKHLEEIDRRISQMKTMRKALRHLIDRCHGDGRPECPILDELAGRDERGQED